MKRMNEVFELPVDKSAAFAYGFATIEEAAKSGKYPAAQHAAHAINNVDALADALYGLLAVIDKRDLGKYGLKSYESEESALDAYRGTK